MVTKQQIFFLVYPKEDAIDRANQAIGTKNCIGQVLQQLPKELKME
jgi:hypothetical protein